MRFPFFAKQAAPHDIQIGVGEEQGSGDAFGDAPPPPPPPQGVPPQTTTLREALGRLFGATPPQSS